MRLYKCPKCRAGRRAPEQMHKDDTRRFCLSCSDETGRLVRMIVPTLEVAKVTAKQKRAAKSQARREVEQRREWERLHTWPGVREARWKKWSKGIKHLPNDGKLPIVRDRSTVAGHYMEIFRLGLPRLGEDDVKNVPIVTERVAFLRRLEIDDELVTLAAFTRMGVTGSGDLIARFIRTVAEGNPRLFNVVRSDHVGPHAIDWLIEDLGLTDATAIKAVRHAAERADLDTVDDVKSLNTIILNALALAAADANDDSEPAEDNHDDDRYEPLGGWQGG